MGKHGPGRRINSKNRCERCRMVMAFCLCDAEPCIDNRTRIVVIRHALEGKKPTNTASLVQRCLARVEMVSWEGRGGPYIPPELPPGRTVLLFPRSNTPSISAAVLRDHVDHITVVVPDGTWRQASKMSRQVPGLCQLPVIQLSDCESVSRYQMRRQHRAHGMATAEAVGHLLTALEGEEIGGPLLEIFARMSEGVVRSRRLRTG